MDQMPNRELLHNDYGASVYPFTVSVPFPSGMIKDIKIAVKNKAQRVFVSSISGSSKSFVMSLSTQNQFLGSFEYNGNLWMTVQNDAMFGFVQLNTLPSVSFQYVGAWYLDRGCYTFPIELKGLSKVYVNSQQVKPSTQLSLVTTGNIKSVKQDRHTCILKRSTPFLINPMQQTAGYSGYVTSVNGFDCISLDIVSSDSSIIVDDLILASQNAYILNISTTGGFPTCNQQRQQSDSIQ